METLLNELAQVGSFVLRNLWRVLPFLALTVPLAVAFRHTGLSSRIRKVIGRGPVLAVAIATAVGAFSPFCSCSVIPVIAASAQQHFRVEKGRAGGCVVAAVELLAEGARVAEDEGQDLSSQIVGALRLVSVNE